MKKLLITLTLLFTASVCAQYNPLRPPPFLRIITDTASIRKFIQMSNYTGDPGVGTIKKNGDTLFINANGITWKFKIGANPIAGQVIKYNGSVWIPGTDSGSGGGTSDTALYALAAPPVGPAGGVLNGNYPTPGMAANVITGIHIQNGNVVRSIKGLTDHVIVQGYGGVVITTNGDTLKIYGPDTTGGGSGITGIQSPNGTINVTDPNGPTASIDLAPAKVGSIEIRDTTIQAVDIKDSTITSQKLHSTFKAPSAAVSDTTLKRPPVFTNEITNDKMADNSVGTNELINQSVTTSKASPTFKAPFAGVADSAAKSGAAVPTGPAGGDIGGTYPNNLQINPLSVGTPELANNSVTWSKIDTSITMPVYKRLYGFAIFTVVGSETTITATTFNYQLGDSNNAGPRWAREHQLGNANLLSYGLINPDLIALVSTSAPGLVPTAVANKWLRTSLSGTVYWGDAPTGTGGGSGDVWSGENSYSGSETRDSVYVPGMNSYDQVNVFAIPANKYDLPVASDYMTAIPDTNYFIALRINGDTAGQPYGWIRNAGLFPGPTNVSGYALSETSLRITWSPPTHRVLDSVVLTYGLTGYDSNYAQSTNRIFINKDSSGYTLTGLTRSLKYFVTLWSWSKSDETSLFSETNHDTLWTLTEEQEESDTLFKATNITDNKWWVRARALTGIKGDGDDIENNELGDSSGYGNHLQYTTAMGSKRAKFKINQATGGIHGNQPGIVFHDTTTGTYPNQDTLIYMRADSVAQYLRNNAPFTLVLVLKLHDTSIRHGLTTNQIFWSAHNTTSNEHWWFRKYDASSNNLRGEKMNADGTAIQATSSNQTLSSYEEIHIYEFIYNGTSLTIYRDGTQMATVADNLGATSAQFFTLGCGQRYIENGAGGYYAGMTFFEGALWAKAATANDRAYYLRKLDDLYGTSYSY